MDVKELNDEIVKFWDEEIKKYLDEGKIAREMDVQCFLHQKIESLISTSDYFRCYNNIFLKSRQNRNEKRNDFDIVIFKYINEIPDYLRQNKEIKRTDDFYVSPKYYPAIVIEIKYPQDGANFEGIKADIKRVSSLSQNTDYLKAYAEPKIEYAHVLFITTFSGTQGNKTRLENFQNYIKKEESDFELSSEVTKVNSDAMRKKVLLTQILAYKNIKQPLEKWAKYDLYFGRISLSKKNKNI